MPQTNPKHPETLTLSEAAVTLRHIQIILWGVGQAGWDANKEWDAGTIEKVAAAMASVGLRPDEKRGTK